ncbi:hypothetical protein FB45DRAFT_1075413 [Roridomyces roridus]|uniref:F-box domain-containing protein n=1 Tax=Roridomyces roridus TaxID=1738132 RepID=A0AAD7CI30_9AGAR|nr:hypothetical protein FB45DRAFT_1075413 [Roridomyces roridus]
MDSRPSCDALCSLHCVSTVPLSSPFPELYSNGVPSNSQHMIISESIRRAKQDLLRVEAEIATLKAQRAELKRFISVHTGMVSAMRRFPNEILAEIFSRCVDPDAAFDPLGNEVWILARVCQRWRAVASDTPELWRNFVLKGTGGNLTLSLKIQLDRARSAPLSICFWAPWTLDVMDIFLDVPAQWVDVQLSHTAVSNRFLSQDSHFPRLRRLEITGYWSPLLEGRTSTKVDMVDSLPALEDLSLDLHRQPFPRQLLLPWSQLGTCTLRQLRTLDILWILSLVSQDTHVSLLDFDSGPDFVARESPIRSVEIGGSSSAYTQNMLSAMILPNLEKLEIGWAGGPDISPGVISLLNRSGCHLKHLRLSQGG